MRWPEKSEREAHFRYISTPNHQKGLFFSRIGDLGLDSRLQPQNPTRLWNEARRVRGRRSGPGSQIVDSWGKNGSAMVPRGFHAASSVFSPEMDPMPWW